MQSAVAAETIVIDAATNTAPGCSSYVPKSNNYSMQISAGATTTLTKIFIRISSPGTSDQIHIRSINNIGASGTLLGTFNFLSQVNTGSYYEAVFTGSVNVTSGTKYWVNYSGATGNICHDTTSPTYSGGFSLVSSGGNYQWAYISNAFAEVAHWNMRIYADINTDNTPPTFPSSETFIVNENQSSVGVIRTSESATISIFSGVDQARFSLIQNDSTTAALSFLTSPNFEIPTDSGLDNGYQVVLRAIDAAGNTGLETVTATVTDVDENARVTSHSITGSLLKGASATITVTLNYSGKVTISVNGKRVPGCISKASSGSGPITATCTWRPSVRGPNAVTFKVVPTAANNFSTTSAPISVVVGSRTNSR